MKNIIVIGAGILGASTAYHLAKAGQKVTVIDRKDPGQATDAAAGIICPWLTQRRNKAWYALAKAGAAYYPTLIQSLQQDGETDTGYAKVGAISLYTDESKLVKMKERAIERRKAAPEIGEVHLLSHTDTKSFFPLLSNDYASVYVSGAARVNGRYLCNALIRAAKKHGAQFINGSAQLINRNHQIHVQIDGEKIDGNKIIITVGAWASELLKPLGLHLQVRGQKGQIVHLSEESIRDRTMPVIMQPNNQYILPFRDGRVIIGATHEDDVQFDMSVTAGGIHEILTKALTVAPGLHSSTLTEVRVGYRPHTPNFQPIIGAIPGHDHLLLANGLGASGLTMGPYLGQQLSKLALGEQVDIDLRPYDVSSVIV